MEARRQTVETSGSGARVSDTTHETGAGLRVPLLDLRAQYAQIRNEIYEAIDGVLERQQFVLGPEVEAFEREIADYVGCVDAVGVSSGTDALLAALMALGIGSGHEVITTGYSFAASADTIVRTGARPVFCDIDPATFNLSSDAVAAFVEDSCETRSGRLVNLRSGLEVRAIMGVHLFGHPVRMDPLRELAARHGLFVIEDAAQALGAETANGQRVGSLGEVGCFSFFPSKNLGAFGDGGMCTTNDPEIAERLRMIRSHGASSRHHHVLIGGNFRLDELQAAVLRVKLRHLDGWTEARRSHAAQYERMFGAEGDLGVTPPITRDGVRHVFNQYVIRVTERDRLRAFLADRKIETALYYPEPLHRQPCFEGVNPPEALPESTRASLETIALPMYPELSEKQIRHVGESIASFFRSGDPGD